MLIRRELLLPMAALVILASASALKAEWYVKIGATVEQYGDLDNRAGGREGAEWGYDQFDIPEPPNAPNNYILVYFPPMDDAPNFYHRFSTNFIPEDAWQEGTLDWDFFVKTDRNDRDVDLEFTSVDLPGEDFDLLLEDNEAGTIVDLGDDNHYSYESHDNSPRSFTLHYGNIVEVEMSEPADEFYAAGSNIHVAWSSNMSEIIAGTLVEFQAFDGADWDELGTAGAGELEFDFEAPDIYSATSRARISIISGTGHVFDSATSAQFSIGPVYMASDVSAGWSFISLPLIPGDNSPEAVLGDDFGEEQFWVFDYEEGQGFVAADELVQGRGYWLAAPVDAEIDIQGDPDFDLVTLPLAQGWNLLGNPYPVDTELETVNILTGGNTYTLDEAADENLISPVLYTMQAPSEDYEEGETFESWKGYWFMAIEPDLEVEFNPVLTGGNPERDDQNASNRELDSWFITIGATQGGSGDLLTRFGAEPSATDGFNARYDFPEPPQSPSEAYVSAYFRHEDWNQDVASAYNRDICRPFAVNENHEWILTVETGQAGETTISWPEIADQEPLGEGINLEPAFNFTLEDLESGETVPMGSGSSYTYHSDGTHQFKITTAPLSAPGTGLTGIPAKYTIAGAYPNPFNNASEIVYGLPVGGLVSIRAFDVTGREAAVLERGMRSAGYHSIRFNAAGLATGSYIVRMDAGVTSTTRILVLVK